MDKTTAEIVFFVIGTTVILVLLAVLVINLLLVGRNRRLRHNNEMLEMKASYEKELIHTQIEVAEQTLNDMARELHDDVGQMLTFSILQLNTVKHTEDPQLVNQLTGIRTSVQNTLQSVRSISKTLSSDYISSFGIFDSLHKLFERIQKQGIQTTLLFPAEILFRSRNNELFSFRIIQELVSNTLRHSGASQISLSISEENNYIHFSYEDNGKGMSPDPVQSNGSGLGLANVQKRINLMKGSMEVPTVASGFQMKFSFPNE